MVRHTCEDRQTDRKTDRQTDRQTSLVSNSIYTKKDTNGSPSANKVVSTDEPRSGPSGAPTHLTQSHPSAEGEPISKGHCWKQDHEAESLMMHIHTMGPKELNIPYSHLLLVF